METDGNCTSTSPFAFVRCAESFYIALFKASFLSLPKIGLEHVGTMGTTTTVLGAA